MWVPPPLEQYQPAVATAVLHFLHHLLGRAHCGTIFIKQDVCYLQCDEYFWHTVIRSGCQIFFYIFYLFIYLSIFWNILAFFTFTVNVYGSFFKRHHWKSKVVSYSKRKKLNKNLIVCTDTWRGLTETNILNIRYIRLRYKWQIQQT